MARTLPQVAIYIVEQGSITFGLRNSKLEMRLLKSVSSQYEQVIIRQCEVWLVA